MNDPWKEIGIPGSGKDLSARRVDPKHPFDLFWARDIGGHCLFVLEYGQDVSSTETRPKLNGIEIIEPVPDDGNKRLILALRNRENREIFYSLCIDIMQAVSRCHTENSALHVFLRRTWRWHQLLRGGAAGRLSPEAQKGLIGELTFLSDILLDRFPASEALAFWQGPSGAPKDFSIGSTSVEVKARKGDSHPYVSISSEFQLDGDGISNLFLYVIGLAVASGKEDSAFTLDQYVQKVRIHIEQNDPGMVDLFETKLLEVGYCEEDCYSDIHWIRVGERIFQVTEGFPRVTHSAVPKGIQDVIYKLNLTECEDYAVGSDKLLLSISGG